MTRMERERRRFGRIAATVGLLLVAVVVLMILTSDAEDREEDAPAVSKQAAYRAQMPELVIECDPDTPLFAEEEESTQATYLSDDIPLDHDQQRHLMSVCDEFGVPTEIVLAVIQAESSFRPDARNGNCHGYMQINKINLQRLSETVGVTDLTDPYQNITAGTYMLHELYEKYGDWHKVLACYNYGEGGAQKHVFSKGYTTTKYSRAVMSYAQHWAGVIGA